MAKNKIKCNVKACDHNDKDCCELDSVKISCTCDKNECESTDETICESFENTTTDEDDENEDDE